MFCNHYQRSIVGYWRCYTINFVFDYYVREDGFHIAGIPEKGAEWGKLMPMTLWLSVETSHEIMVSNEQRSSIWTRDYYRDGKRLVMLDYGDPDSRSVSYPIRIDDLSEEMTKMVAYFDKKYSKL